MHPSKRGARAAAGFLGIGLGLASLRPEAAIAQGAAPTPAIEAPGAALLENGARVWRARTGCYNCHGWAGNGEPEFNYPRGADLRKTGLPIEAIANIVRCGLPGTEMPYHDRAAYTDNRCYGQTKEQLGDQTPPPGGFLQPAQVDAVAAYVAAKVKGRGPITKAECVEYFGAASAVCALYP